MFSKLISALRTNYLAASFGAGLTERDLARPFCSLVYQVEGFLVRFDKFVCGFSVSGRFDCKALKLRFDSFERFEHSSAFGGEGLSPFPVHTPWDCFRH